MAQVLDKEVELLAEDGNILSNADLSPHGFSIDDPWLRDPSVPPFPRIPAIMLSSYPQSLALTPPPIFQDGTPQEDIDRFMTEYHAKAAA